MNGMRGRGADDNPANRFEALHLEPDPEWNHGEDPAPTTRFFRDATSSIINYNDSPDIGFDASINPYRDVSTAAFTATRDRPTSILAFPPVSISRAESW